MIHVKKYNPKVFRMLIEFVHSGVVTLNAETVSGNSANKTIETFDFKVKFTLSHLANFCQTVNHIACN